MNMFNWFKKKKVYTGDQLAIIANEVKLIQSILKVGEIDNDAHIETQRKNFEIRQNTCSNCRSVNVINKYVTEIKYSTTYPRFTFQSPTKYSYSVNNYIKHCVNCGNEWDKRNWYVRYTYKDTRSYYQRFCDIDRFTMNELPKYKEFHAESMHRVFSDIPMKFFTNHFKSV